MYDEMEQCEYCGGPLELLGVLGRLEWSTCQDCGLRQAIPVDDNPQELHAAGE